MPGGGVVLGCFWAGPFGTTLLDLSVPATLSSGYSVVGEMVATASLPTSPTPPSSDPPSQQISSDSRGWLPLKGAGSPGAGNPASSTGHCRADCRATTSDRMAMREAVGLETVRGASPSRVQIPPPPLCVRRPTVFVTAAHSPSKSTGISARPLSLRVTGAQLAHRGVPVRSLL
jgi:hypothetical protein